MSYDFLKGYEGKIVVLSSPYDKWKQEREKYLFDGTIQDNHRLREILDKEIIIEFDHLQEWEIGSEQFQKARAESEKWISEIEGILTKKKKYFKETDHKGKSPHLRFYVDGLEHYPKQYAQEFKLRLVEAILKEINFKSELVELDRSLLTSDKKLISLEGKPHFKEKWKGNVEEVIYEHSSGEKYQVQKERMDEIITELNQSFKIDNKEINLDPVDIKDVDVKGLIQIWKEHYKEGYRNALLMALGGLCRRKGISQDDGKKLLKTLLEAVGKPEFYHKTSKELAYSWELKPEEVAVYSHLKRIGDKADEIYKKLKRCFMSKEEKEYIKVKLSQLNASYVGKNVSVDCQITGEQSQKAVPVIRLFECLNPECEKTVHKNYSPYESIFNNTKPEGCECSKNPKFRIVNSQHRDHSVLFVRDLLIKDENFTQKNYESKRVYLLGKELLKTKVISIKGEVIIEPKTNNLSIIAQDIKPLKNVIEDFQLNEQMKQDFKTYFNGSYDLANEINPDIVGEKRKIAKKCIIAHLHSPSQIYDIHRSKIIRGGINVSFYGDSKLGKSEIAKDISNIRYYELSEYASAETGGRTGLLYTIDTDKKAIIWGAIALNDMGSVVIDGLQKFSSDEIGEFREVLESQRIIVKKSIQGEALARTRIVGCFNPYKTMNEYPFKCEAIRNNSVFYNTPDITRFDLFVPFCEDDVPDDEIADRGAGERKIPKDIFINHIYWVWSRKPEQIEYTPSAILEIKEKSKELMKNYSIESLPVVHKGVREILTRLAISKACELHSTDESNEKVIVEKDHINKAVEFYEEVLDLLELSQYKQDQLKKSQITQDEMKKILSDLEEMELSILNEIKSGTKSSIELSSKLNVSSKTIKRHYDKLREYELIETRTGKGSCLSVKGVKFIRWLNFGDGGLQNLRDIGTKDVPNKNMGTRNVPMSLDNYRPLSKKNEPSFPVEEELIEDPESEILQYIKQNPKDNAVVVDEKYDSSLIKKMITQGIIMENPRGTYRALE